MCVEDFFRRFGRGGRPDRYYLRLARVLTLAWGAIAIGAGLLFMRVSYAQIAWGKLMAYTTNGILGLVALAFLPFRIRPAAAAAGFVAAAVALFAMRASNMIFLLWPVIGNAVCFVFAILADRVMRRLPSPARPIGG